MNVGPIRIAQMMTKMNYGGVEKVIMNYYENIDRSIFQFDFFVFEGSIIPQRKRIEELGGRIYVVPKCSNLLKYEKVIKKIFRENKYTIVHSNMNTLSVFSLYAAKNAGIPIRIVHNHSVSKGDSFIRKIIKDVLRFFSKRYATDYFACSEIAGRWMYGEVFFDLGKVNIVKNAIDFKKFFIPLSVVESLKNKYKLKEKFVIAIIGRLTYAKNHKFLIRVFKEIYEIRKDAVLLIVGDGELKSSIKNLIVKLNIENKVIFVGQVDDPEKYYGLANVVAIPSLFEGLSLTAIESQISRIPVVASKAIPDEAIISDACVRVDLDEKKWVKTILESNGRIVNLNELAEAYDISEASKKLEKLYIQILKRNGL